MHDTRSGLYISAAGHAAILLWAALAGLFNAPPRQQLLESASVTLLSAEEFSALVSAPAPPPEGGKKEAAPEEIQAAETPVVSEEDRESTAPDPELETEQPLPDPEQKPGETPNKAERVDSKASAKASESARVSAETQAATSDAKSEKPVPEARAEKAPEESTTAITPDAEENEGLAPIRSIRPRRRAQAAEDQSEQSAQSEIDKEILAAIQANERKSDPLARPLVSAGLTGQEQNALRISVQKCWNVGSLSSAALRVTVTVAVSLDERGFPIQSSIRQVQADGSGGAARQAYEAARRAIIRCGASGYNLPSEKYASWRNLELTFNPEKMRVR